MRGGTPLSNAGPAGWRRYLPRRRTIALAVLGLLLAGVAASVLAILVAWSPMVPEVTGAQLWPWLREVSVEAGWWLLDTIGFLVIAAVVIVIIANPSDPPARAFDARCRGTRSDGQRCSKDGVKRYDWYCATHKWQDREHDIIWHDD